MESLLENLTNFDVSGHQNNPSQEHPHYALYKVKHTSSSQEERRKKILEARKESRYDLLMHLRNIEENIEDETEDAFGDMAVDDLKAVYQKPREYCNFVMLSEWLVDVPDNFCEKYIAILCPVGKRCLCVCYKGRTSIYAKNGRRIKQFTSLLPGGSGKTYKFGFTVLDCIWSEATRTFYIIDLVFWHKQSFMECDTSFRFSWLRSRIKEFEEDVTTISPCNKFRFVPVPFYDCSKSTLSTMFDDTPFEDVALDGILFYHKETHYTHGPSPLVCWLKAYMFPEILGVNVSPRVMQEKPAHYTNIASHIIEFNQEMDQRKTRRKKEQTKEKMEVGSTEPSDGN